MEARTLAAEAAHRVGAALFTGSQCDGNASKTNVTTGGHEDAVTHAGARLHNPFDKFDAHSSGTFKNASRWRARIPMLLSDGSE